MSNVTDNALALNPQNENFATAIQVIQNCNTSNCSTTAPALFEFGVNANAHNKQAIGGFESLTKNWETRRGTVGDLVGWVSSGRAFMVGTLPNANTRRKKSNVVSAQAIALDIDGGLSIEECLALPVVKDYAAAIYTSASHQKVKGNEPACDRYRVIFVLPEALTDTALYEAVTQNLMDLVGSADRACKDASRMFFGYDKTEVVLCDDTKVLPAAFIEEARDRLEKEKEEKRRQVEERRRYREEYGEDENTEALIQQALDHIDPDCPYEEWLAIGLALHSHDTGLFWLWDSWSGRGSKYPSSRSLERQWSKFTQGGGVTIGSLFHIAKDYGFKFPERQYQPGNKRKGDRLVDGLSFAKRRASEFMQWLTGKAAGLGDKAHKGFAADQLPPVEPPNVIRWSNGDPVPTREDYGSSPLPKIVYARGSNPQELISKLRAAGWSTVLDSSFMGEGKTHRAGSLYFEGERGIYLDTNHNSPSVENVEKNYTNLWPRHKGLWRDEFGKLSRNGEGKAEVPSNCESAYLFSQLADKGYGDLLAGDNPICAVCPHLGYCHTKRGIGFGHKYERGLAMAATQIRADIQSLPSATDEDYTGTYLIVEEATTQARAAIKQHTGTFKDLLHNLDKVEQHSKEVYAALLPLKDALRGLDNGTIQGDRYGVTHAQIVEALPPVPTNPEEIIPAVMFALMPNLDLEKADRVSGAGKEYKHLERIVNREYRGEAQAVNEQRLANVPNNVLLPLVELWLGKTHTHVSFNHGEFTITQPDQRKQEIIKAAGFRVLLDATPNGMAIAHGFGLAQGDIIQVEQELPALNNLTVYQTNMTGIKTRQRSESAKKRIEAYKAQWVKADPAVEFLGFKGEDGISGYWHNHHRGSNQFKGKQSLVSFGLPHLHIGAVQAEFYALTGSLDGWENYYQELVKDEVTQWIGRPRAQRYPDIEITVDMVATYGEDFDLSFLSERYGVKVVTREAVEFCHAAGTTKEQLKTNIIGIAAALNEAGTKLTQQAIANALGISQSTLSEHLKALWGNWLAVKKFLSENLYGTNSKTDKTEPTNMAGDPIIAASLLVELFSLGGWSEIEQFLRSAPPPEQQRYLAALLQTAAIA